MKINNKPSKYNLNSFREFEAECRNESVHEVPMEIRTNPKYIIFKRYGLIGERYAEYLIRGGREIPEERNAIFKNTEIH